MDIAPLAGVIISVGKKLAVHQTEYNSIVAEVGGDYQWKYSKACTHFIFQVGHHCLRRLHVGIVISLWSSVMCLSAFFYWLDVYVCAWSVTNCSIWGLCVLALDCSEM